MQQCIHNTVNFLKWCKTNIFMYILNLYYNLPFLVHDVAFRQMWTSQPCEPDYKGQWLETETLLGTQVYPSELRLTLFPSHCISRKKQFMYIYIFSIESMLDSRNIRQLQKQAILCPLVLWANCFKSQSGLHKSTGNLICTCLIYTFLLTCDQKNIIINYIYAISLLVINLAQPQFQTAHQSSGGGRFVRALLLFPFPVPHLQSASTTMLHFFKKTTVQCSSIIECGRSHGSKGSTWMTMMTASACERWRHWHPAFFLLVFTFFDNLIFL